ncbi:DinB family protein [Candidatus Latescibacterota bacterium]
MNWTELLTEEIESTYRTAYGLFDLVDDDAIDWKPSTGENWMTTGQLLMHIATDDWGMPEGVDVSDLPPEEMLPPAEKLPSVGSVAQAKKLLEEDHRTAIDMLAKTTEEDLAGKMVGAPWDPRKRTLGHQLLIMVNHLSQHKAQLYYYLKLQGKPVNTGNLWGM